MASPDVVVIGGGIVGTAAAAFLAEGGASVVLLERDAVGAGASGRNSGVVQQPFDRVLAPLYRDSVRAYRALAAAEVGFDWAAEPA
ncbi:MAG: sarcosine oxidase subunit beta, partial [Chloroflexota bacterium]